MRARGKKQRRPTEALFVGSDVVQINYHWHENRGSNITAKLQWNTKILFSKVRSTITSGHYTYLYYQYKNIL